MAFDRLGLLSAMLLRLLRDILSCCVRSGCPGVGCSTADHRQHHLELTDRFQGVGLVGRHDSYREWLLQFNDLRDYAIGHQSFRLRDSELETFRNHPGEAYVERLGPRGRYKVYRQPVLPYRHLADRRNNTVWVSNSSKHDVLLLNLDVDAKNGEPDAQQLTEFIASEYLQNHLFIEPSRHGFGRHGYFLVNVTRIKRLEVWDVVNRLVSVIQRDLVIQRFSSRLDTILGSPTLWQQPEGPASRLRDMDTCRSSNDWCLRRHSGGIDGRRSITHDCQIL